ncbi:MAG: alpha-glucuronidase family glycosyl hydrolase [Bacteroidota bacterium]|nr:alpha-glucuronidase family glycosyl hydrolase [Bacteroidota bacterium]
MFALVLNVFAESGYELWMRYNKIDDKVVEIEYNKSLKNILINFTLRSLNVASVELNQAITGLLSLKPDNNNTLVDGTIIVGTLASSDIIRNLNISAEIAKTGDEGFLIKSTVINGKSCIVITSNRGIGALYGSFHFIRLLQTYQPISKLNTLEVPKLKSDYTSEELAKYWIKMAFTHDETFIKVISKMMLQSRETAVDMRGALGLNHIMNYATHYGPGPWYKDKRWDAIEYHRADEFGLGVNRTATGSNVAGQYAPEVARLFSKPETCPEMFLLYFNHVSWDYKMPSGRNLWEELLYHYYNRKVDGIPAMNFDWWNYGGILRDVFMIETPTTYISDYKVQLKKSSPDLIQGYVKLEGATAAQLVEIAIPELKIELKLTTNKNGLAAFEMKSKPALWEPCNPKLYKVAITTN